MAVHKLKDEVLIKASLEDVWNFFSNPKNLQRITPQSMGFKHVYEPEAEKVYPGMLLVYKVSPLLGIPLTWVTEITAVETQRRFVDNQRIGPFGMWHHIHEFEATSEGTLARDILYYKMPFGFLGELVHGITVKKQTREMFEYRKQALKKIFKAQ